jgi:phosphoribosyl 1,2-cyclic phosphate phosphodiesterase
LVWPIASVATPLEVDGLELTFLGTGTSHGVPMIGCDCPTCTSVDPRDSRYRSAIMVETKVGEPTHLLVDCPPEFRLQAIRAALPRVDAVLLTHSHADHLFGLDDLRRYNHFQGASIPVYGAADALDDVARAFRYVFTHTQAGGGKPQLDLVTAAPGVWLRIGALSVCPVPIWHGELLIFAFRFLHAPPAPGTSPKGGISYLTDCSGIPDGSVPLLANADVAVIGGLRHRPHSTHFTVVQALKAAESLRAKRVWLTHIAHDLLHIRDNAELPTGAGLAYDGLCVSVPQRPGESNEEQRV